MPRQIDLSPQNLQVTHNPLNQLAMTPGQLTNLVAELTNLPELALEAIEQGITQFLTYLDQATGLDLLPFWQAVENIISSLTTLFGALNPGSGTFDPLVAIQTFLDSVASLGAQIPGGNIVGTIEAAVNASNLFGSIPTNLFSLIPAASISSTNPNLLTNPEFNGAGSIDGAGIWTWDNTVYYTSGTGSAKVTANGVVQTLESNVIPVSSGQTVNFSGNALAHSLTGSGTLIELVCVPYIGTSPQTTVVVDSASGAGASPTAWAATPSGSVTWPLSGSYTVAGSVDSVRMGLVVTAAATAGNVWFANCVAQQSANQGAPLFSQLIDMLVGSGTVTGGTGAPLTGSDALTSVFTDLLSVLGDPVGLGSGSPSIGVLGGDIVTGVQSLVDSVVQGFGNVGTTGNSFADITNIGTNILGTLENAFGLAQTNAAYVNMMPVNMPGYHAVDPSLSGTFNITTLTSATPPTIPVTQGNSAIGMIQIPAAATKTTMVWHGYGNANLSAAYVNLYSVNTATGALSKVYASGNVISYLGTALNWVYVPISTPVAVDQGNWYAAELQVVGTGTHTMVGLPNHWLPANPNVYPQQLGATRNTGIGLGGAASYGAAGQVASGSWTHTLSATDTSIFVALQCDSTSPTCTVGGTSMTLLESFSYSGGYVYVFVLYSPPTGAQTIAWTTSGSSYAAGASASFVGVSSTGTPVTATATGTALSQSATSSVNNDILQVFAYYTGSGTITGYNQTTIANVAGVSAQHSPILLGYAAATGSSQTFSATGSVSDPWAGVAIPLVGPSPAAPSTISSPTYSANVPWLALSSETAGTSPTFLPQTTAFPTAGTYTAPTWAAHIDLIGVGGGGSGQGEQGYNMGSGGLAGGWNGRTLVAGTDFTPGTTVFTVTPGAGGAAVFSYFVNGNNGAATTITWHNVAGTAQTFTCTGGLGGYTGGNSYGGQGAGNYTFNGVTYYGGGGSGIQSVGVFPGGGGGGAAVYSNYAAPGANGEAWTVARQT